MDDRSEAIDILTRMSTNHFYGHREQEAFKLGAEALSAERRGRWKRIIEDPPVYACTECGRTISTYNLDRYPYCNCGAKMDEVLT